MSTKHFYLIRHGETEFNKTKKLQGRGINAPLNETGRNQAEYVAEALQDVAISEIITSSLLRAKESAEPISKLKSIAIESYSALDEMDFGEWEGQPFDDVIDQIKDIQSKWKAGDTHVQVPGGESPDEVFTRSGDFLKKLAKESQHNNIAVVIHGRLIRILLAGLLGIGLKNMHQIKHQNGAINHLAWHEGVFRAIELHRVDHLPKSDLVWDK